MWYPRACTNQRLRCRVTNLPTTMGLFQPGTSLGTLSTTIGSRKTVPFRMFLMVPFGLLHIFFSLNSFTRASSGVIVAHLIPTPFACIVQATDAMMLQVMQIHVRHVYAVKMKGKQDYTIHYRRTHAVGSMFVLCILVYVWTTAI